jgi:hypothetical protein
LEQRKLRDDAAEIHSDAKNFIFVLVTAADGTGETAVRWLKGIVAPYSDNSSISTEDCC